MTPKQIIDKAIAPLATTLKKLGFRKLGRRFYKDVGESRVFLEVQASQWNRKGCLSSFTINLGIFVPEVLHKTNQEVIERPKSLHKCTWQERIGNTTPAKKDVWWEIESEKSLQEVSTSMLKIVSEYALPWLELGATYDGLCQTLAASEGVGPANLLWNLGCKEEAIACIRRVPGANEGEFMVLNEWLESHVI